MKRLLAPVLALCLIASPAWAAWPTPTQVTVRETVSSGALSTPTISIAAGRVAVVLGVARASTFTGLSASDQASNTWTMLPLCNGQGFIAWSKITNALSSQTITITPTGGVTNGMTYSVWSVAGFDTTTPEDTAARACNSSGSATTTPSVTSNVPAFSGDLFFSVWAVPSSATGAAFAAGGSWLPSGGYGTGDGNVLSISDYLDATGLGTAQTNNPATNAKAYSMPIFALKAAGAAVCVPTGTLLGVERC